MKRNKFILSISTLLVALTLLYFGIQGFSSADLPVENEHVTGNDTGINIGLDYPTTSELKEMVETADLVAIGDYENFDRSWNMSRDLEDIYKEDEDRYVEGRIYNFKVDEIIKGHVDSELIEINMRYSEIIEFEESNSVVSPEGIIEKEATEVTIHEIEVIDPLYIEPELNRKYLVFLSKDDDFNNYYGSIEPFSIVFDENGTAELKSNLLDGEHGELTSTTNHTIGGEDIIVEAHVEGEIDDNITGESIEDLVDLIEDIND
ncbi:hypothetical protein AB4027_11455 [Alkalibacterium putridalgicola]|uniref:hypothetical protein n=1 Tax=Alkalibacterium putridalgicola TaxID=426703 RepID=UPI0034CE267B